MASPVHPRRAPRLLPLSRPFSLPLSLSLSLLLLLPFISLCPLPASAVAVPKKPVPAKPAPKKPVVAPKKPVAKPTVVDAVQWQNMVTALAKKRNYIQFLSKIQLAKSIIPYDKLGMKQITLFAPTDAAFAASPKFLRLFRSPKCSNKYFPNGCYLSLTSYMLVPGRLPFLAISQAPFSKYWNTQEGNGIQKFKAPGLNGFIVGPQVHCLGCAARVTGAHITQPNIHVGPNIIVHGISALLAPADVWPSGFN